MMEAEPETDGKGVLDAQCLQWERTFEEPNAFGVNLTKSLTFIITLISVVVGYFWIERKPFCAKGCCEENEERSVNEHSKISGVGQ
ncbi:MAG: hypothetical protein M1330_00755 [Armatimonadetes bacterium]|nr:hypothetical protein [Armatimonadota bacterium]